jgi:hypothetical protein
MQQQYAHGKSVSGALARSGTWAPGVEAQDLRALFERPAVGPVPRLPEHTVRGIFDKVDTARGAAVPPEMDLLRRTADTLWPPADKDTPTSRHAVLHALESPAAAAAAPMELVDDEVIMDEKGQRSAEESSGSESESSSGSKSSESEESDEYRMTLSDAEYAPETVPVVLEKEEEEGEEESAHSGSENDSDEDEESSSSSSAGDSAGIVAPVAETRPAFTPDAWRALLARVTDRLENVAVAMTQGRAPKRPRAMVEAPPAPPPITVARATEAPLAFRRGCEVLVGAWLRGKCGDQTMERQRVALGRLQPVRCNTPAAKNTKASLAEAYTHFWQYSVAPELNTLLFPAAGAHGGA